MILILFLYHPVVPQILPFTFGDETSNTGESIGVSCMITKGDLPLEFRWTFNSSPIVSGENGFTIMKMNSRTIALNIESIDGYHRGIYKCIAKNNAGVVEYSSQLDVNGMILI